MQDAHYARKAQPTLPEKRTSEQLTILFTGQPETGRTTTARNLFASLAGDVQFQPKMGADSWKEFRKSAAPFTTSITCPDSVKPIDVTYTIIVRSPHSLPPCDSPPPVACAAACFASCPCKGTGTRGRYTPRNLAPLTFGKTLLNNDLSVDHEYLQTQSGRRVY